MKLEMRVMVGLEDLERHAQQPVFYSVSKGRPMKQHNQIVIYKDTLCSSMTDGQEAN